MRLVIRRRDRELYAMRFNSFPLVALAGLGLLCGCQTPPTPPNAAPLAATVSTGKKKIDLSTRDNALALLHELLNEEKHVSKLLLIKRETDPLQHLVKNISRAAADGADQLKNLAKFYPDLNMTATGLPVGEKATRDSIAKAKQHTLLHTKGTEFEFQLLLTQSEALGYATHLALVAAENEPQPARAQQFAALSSRFKDLHEQVLVMLRQRR